jgi:hypothetical protein
MWQAAIVSFKLKIVAFNKLSMPPHLWLPADVFISPTVSNTRFGSVLASVDLSFYASLLISLYS